VWRLCVWSRPSIEHRVPWDCDCLNIKWVGRTLFTMPAGLGRAWPDLANKGYARYVVGSWNYSLHSTHKLDAHNKGIRMRTSHHHHPHTISIPTIIIIILLILMVNSCRQATKTRKYYNLSFVSFRSSHNQRSRTHSKILYIGLGDLV